MRCDKLLMAAVLVAMVASGAHAELLPNGVIGDEQTSIVYFCTGELGVDAPASTNLTSVNIDSASGIFVNHENAQHLEGSFDTHSDSNIFKATFGSSFGSLSFGQVAVMAMSEDFVANDLTVIGSLDGGGGLGDVDLWVCPEPSSLLLALLGIVGLLRSRIGRLFEVRTSRGAKQ